MEEPAEPSASLGRSRRFLGGKRSRHRENHEGKSKAPAHQRLISKRCKSCQTLYQSAMKSVAVSVFLALTFATCGLAKTHSTFRAHVQANPRDGPAFSTNLRLFGRDVTI